MQCLLIYVPVVVEIDDSALQELANHNSVLRREKSDQDSAFAREKEQLTSEIARLKAEARSASSELQRERERVASLEQDVTSLKHERGKRRSGSESARAKKR